MELLEHTFSYDVSHKNMAFDTMNSGIRHTRVIVDGYGTLLQVSDSPRLNQFSETNGVIKVRTDKIGSKVTVVYYTEKD